MLAKVLRLIWRLVGGLTWGALAGKLVPSHRAWVCGSDGFYATRVLEP